MIPQVYAIDIRQHFSPAQTFTSVSSFVNLFVPILMTFAAMLTLVMILWGGYTFLSASGDPEKIAHSKKIMQFAILGLLIIVGSFLFAKLIAVILGITIL